MLALTLFLVLGLILGNSPVLYTSASSDKVAEFLNSQNWQIVPGSEEHGVYTVPREFGKVMQGYNDLQLSQGFDLSEYAEKVVEKYSYTVSNYPGYENTDYIKANVYVYNGEIIAGDICSVRLNGFMEGIIRTDGKDKT